MFHAPGEIHYAIVDAALGSCFRYSAISFFLA